MLHKNHIYHCMSVTCLGLLSRRGRGTQYKCHQCIWDIFILALISTLRIVYISCLTGHNHLNYCYTLATVCDWLLGADKYVYIPLTFAFMKIVKLPTLQVGLLVFWRNEYLNILYADSYKMSAKHWQLENIVFTICQDEVGKWQGKLDWTVLNTDCFRFNMCVSCCFFSTGESTRWRSIGYLLQKNILSSGLKVKGCCLLRHL